MLLQGTDIALLNPKGLIAQKQFNLMIFSVAVILVVLIPTLIILYSFAWKYRERNDKATYDSRDHNSKLLVFSMWSIPTIIMLMLAFVMWPATHDLHPRKSIAADAKPITIQVIAMRWKWLFIYPEQNIATVNFIQIPTDTPIKFELSADETPMSSFWIPHLGGQLYAMTGHVNQINLMANEPGEYPGSSAEINGAGFAGMKFVVRAGSSQEFEHWVQSVKTSPEYLDNDEYSKLLEPSENHPAMYYSNTVPDLYYNLIMKYSASHNHPKGHQ